MHLLLPIQSERQWERLALLPADPQATPEVMVAALVGGGAEFLDFLDDFGLCALWHCRLGEAVLSLPDAARKRLQAARGAAAARYLGQLHALRELDRLFEGARIVYAAMKGSVIRERLHEDPSVMTACDIDVLVAPQDRVRAADALLRAGYEMHLDPANVSHEALFRSPFADIDLHWNILRPGRTRIDLSPELLARRARINGFWGLSDTDCTFVMLTHPAFAKYVCSPHMGLARVTSFLLWSPKVAAQWPAVLALLERAGMKTAAWAMLGWFIGLAPSSLRPQLAEFRQAVEPGWLRAFYLQLWIRHNLPTRFSRYPFASKLGMTPLLHDRLSDALRAARHLFAVARSRAQDLHALQLVERPLR